MYSRKNIIIISFLILFVSIAIFIFMYSSIENSNNFFKDQTIVAFGDSLIKGYGSTKHNDFVSDLSRDLEVEIENLGINGNTTKDGLNRIDTVLQLKPDITILLLGGNDFLQGVPKQQTFTTLREIISKLKNNGSKVLLLGIQGGYLIDEYKDDFMSLSKEQNVAYVPNVLSGLIGNKDFMFDLIHPNDAGYKKIAQKIAPALKKLISSGS